MAEDKEKRTGVYHETPQGKLSDKQKEDSAQKLDRLNKELNDKIFNIEEKDDMKALAEKISKAKEFYLKAEAEVTSIDMNDPDIEQFRDIRSRMLGRFNVLLDAFTNQAKSGVVK